MLLNAMFQLEESVGLLRPVRFWGWVAWPECVLTSLFAHLFGNSIPIFLFFSYFVFVLFCCNFLLLLFIFIFLVFIFKYFLLEKERKQKKEEKNKTKKEKKFENVDCDLLKGVNLSSSAISI